MREFTKKSIVLLFTAAMIFTLAACGNGETTNINATNASESESDAHSESESDEEAEEEAPYSVGDSIYFGNYEQDGNEANGAESIEWLVLDQVDNRILVTSKYVLDCQAYHTESTAVTWEDCTLRAWLNGDFFNHAFSEEELKLLQPLWLMRIMQNMVSAAAIIQKIRCFYLLFLRQKYILQNRNQLLSRAASCGNVNRQLMRQRRELSRLAERIIAYGVSERPVRIAIRQR